MGEPSCGIPAVDPSWSSLVRTWGSRLSHPTKGEPSASVYVANGVIAYYPSDETYVAYCTRPEHEGSGRSCERCRTARGPAPGSRAPKSQGRRLGSLMAWLEDDTHGCRDDHVKLGSGYSREQRTMLRGLLMAVKDHNEEFPEREQYAWEGVEPEKSL